MLLCLFGCKGVFSNQVTDTPPEEAETGAAKVAPITIYDTVRVSVAIIKKPNNKSDTVRTVTLTPKEVKTFSQKAAAVRSVYTKYIGVTEKTGRNDGEPIKTFLGLYGLKEGNPYCAAAVGYIFWANGIKTNVTPWSPTTFNIKDIVFYKKEFKKTPLAGADVISFYFPSMKRIAHCGFWDKEHNQGMYESVEFNTSGGSGINRDGGGVFRKIRSYNATFAISRHIKE